MGMWKEFKIHVFRNFKTVSFIKLYSYFLSQSLL
ncbi:hypothetical protein HMPREF9296_1721 [Prevotella disiens FB035-09AN]|uniref:Uncharacterized protein n=1 Tax=Prevotella disiens FB035-09AN TaxID=866771 RepID=E1KSR0_9BACT|nr:hypothetical protein HMPREF9296_1721 [Prevotella disiens FB035-09AN]